MLPQGGSSYSQALVSNRAIYMGEWSSSQEIPTIVPPGGDNLGSGCRDGTCGCVGSSCACAENRCACEAEESFAGDDLPGQVRLGFATSTERGPCCAPKPSIHSAPIAMPLPTPAAPYTLAVPHNPTSLHRSPSSSSSHSSNSANSDSSLHASVAASESSFGSGDPTVQPRPYKVIFPKGAQAGNCCSVGPGLPAPPPPNVNVSMQQEAPFVPLVPFDDRTSTSHSVMSMFAPPFVPQAENPSDVLSVPQNVW